MKSLPAYLLLLVLIVFSIQCDQSLPTANRNSTNAAYEKPTARPVETAESKHQGRVIHVLVALCDNINQGIVPVPARLGNGEDLQSNLYWGAAYGVKAFFNRKDSDWRLLASLVPLNSWILERCIFKHKDKDVYLIADAYKGAEIKRCIADLFDYAASNQQDNLIYQETEIAFGGNADLLVYIGHDGLMDFSLNSYPKGQNDKQRETILLCCMSKQFFAAPLRSTGAVPLLWTTGLMAPEAYILKAALDGWLVKETGEQIRQRAAAAYHKYQHCGLKSAVNLFTTGW